MPLIPSVFSGQPKADSDGLSDPSSSTRSKVGQDVFPVGIKAGAHPSGDLFLILDR